MMLVGSNSERVDREVSTQEGSDLAKKLKCNFVEASAKNCISVEEAFYDVVRQLRRDRELAVVREWARAPLAPRNAPRFQQSQKKVRGISQVWKKVKPGPS
jgi:hypothetical protein